LARAWPRWHRLADADDLLEGRHQLVDLVGTARLAEPAEIVEIVAQLAGLDVQRGGQLPRRDLLDPGLLQQNQLVEIKGQSLDRGVGHAELLALVVD